jgi:hypothetical protein
MGDLRRDGPESRRRAAAQDPDAAPAPAHTVPAGVSNQLLARALSTSNPPAGAMLQRVFQFKGKQIPGEAKVPRIHGVSPTDLQKLADDERDYGAITDARSVAAAMEVYERNHTVVEAPLPLDEMYAGYRTVWTDNAFAEHEGLSVRATFQLDSMQGKHDAEFASDKDARKKSGGQQMPPGSDYEALAQGVPAELARDRLDQIFENPARAPLNFSVQKIRQWDGYHYEISAMWAPLDEGRLHLLVYYHCYPPR